MTPQDADRAAELLAAARQNAKFITLDGALCPATVNDAYAVQAALARRAGGVAGWKIMGVVPSQLKALNIEHPIAAPLFSAYMHQNSLRVPLAKFVAPMLEAEFDFVLARDLPARATPYSVDEVAAAVKELRPAIEIVDSRVGRPQPTPVTLADCFGNGGLVTGTPVSDWRGLDLLKHEITVTVDGKRIAGGNGAVVPNGPLAALTVLANNAPPWSGGLKAGQIVTTGSCTGMPPLGGGREVVADFGTLGEVRISFTA
jgi:2-keto-4-pentenoate hydratase